MAALDGMQVDLSVQRIVNLVQVTVYPVETVGAVQEIWRARTTLRLAPGETRVIYANFRDDNGQRVGAVEVVAPVATTDYTVNDRADGSGFDYTSDPAFSIVTVTEATRMKITLGNTATGPLYVTLLKVRGKPIRVYDPITLEASDATSQTTYEKRSVAFDLRMQPDAVFGASLAGYLVSRYKDPAPVVDRVLVRGRDVISTVNVFSLELMDKVVVSDPVTGMDGAAHWLRGVEYDIGAQSYSVTLHLERADDRRYWLLGKPGYSELGSTTRLGL